MSPTSADPAEVYGRPDVEIKDSVWEMLNEGLSAHPDRPAVETVAGSSSSSDATSSTTVPGECKKTWTYAQLNAASLKLATYLASRTGPGARRIALFSWNTIEAVTVYWASAHLRGVFIPLDPRLLLPDRAADLDRYLPLVRADVLIATDSERDIYPTLPSDLRISLLPSKRPGWTDLATVLSSVPDPADPLSTLPSDAVIPPSSRAQVSLYFTSGTTSTPKPVPHTAATHSPLASDRYLHPEVRILLTGPLFRPVACLFTLGAWRAGACVVIPSAVPDVAAAVGVAHGPGGATHAALVPAQVRAWERAVEGRETKGFEAVSIVGEVVTPDVQSLAMRLFPGAQVEPALGMTEVGEVASWRDGAEVTFAEGVAGVGRPVSGAVVRVVRSGTREVASRGEKGELWVAGQGVLEGYADGSAANSFVDVEDLKGRKRRWLVTGDWAMIDEDGILYILGRFKDVIVRNGINLSPVAIETCLNGVGIKEVQVFGMPDKEAGSVPVAVVKSLRDLGRSKESIAQEAGQGMGPDNELAAVFDLEELGLKEWPVNSAGKIDKLLLQSKVRSVQ